MNCRAEGPSRDASINALRGRQQRNLLATLLLSQGVPMLLAGDELGHTQLGNNNAYWQDSPLTRLNRDLAPEQREVLEFVRGLIRLRTRNPVFRHRTFFQGRPIHGLEVKDLYWLTPAGTEMSAGIGMPETSAASAWACPVVRSMKPTRNASASWAIRSSSC